MALDQQQEAQPQCAPALERSRLARELHDVFAHTLSVMTMQATGARRVLQSDPARAAEALGVIERSGRDALLELRRLLADLLPANTAQAELQVSPGLENLSCLLKQFDQAGVQTELRVEGQAYPLPAEIDLCAYRILQEGLTNALKHAGECRAAVTVRYSEQALELEVQDDGGPNSTRDPMSSGTGNGVAGMSERAAALGGRLDAGFHNGGYRVCAWLPIGR